MQTPVGHTELRQDHPNKEVESNLNASLLIGCGCDEQKSLKHRLSLLELLRNNDFVGLENLIKVLFASIPSQWFTRNDIADYEGYYANVFYSHFAALGLDITVENSSNQECLDMAVCFNNRVYLFEFKVVEQNAEGSAMT